MIGDDNSGIYYLAIFSIIIIGFTFIALVMDYFSTFTIKDTIDTEFKRIVVSEIRKNLTDEYSSDYMAKFKVSDKLIVEDAIRNGFIQKMRDDKNYIINITSLDIQQPSDLTITCSFKGTYDFTPIVAKGLSGIFMFKMPVESKAKVIRLDEH